MAPADPPPADAARHSLPAGSELRIEVGDGSPALVRLVSGSAEVFGVELVEGRTYSLAPARKLAVFTWYGAELALWGSVSSCYASSESGVPLIANLHQRLEARRAEAAAMGVNGPRVRARARAREEGAAEEGRAGCRLAPRRRCGFG